MVITVDRRRRSSAGSLIGMQRITRETLKDYEAEDELYQDRDPAVWLTKYKLKSHHENLDILLLDMGELRVVGDTDTAVRRLSAINHDYGKLEERCQLYRANRKLTPAERRIVREHPIYSARHVRENRDRVRKEDVELRKLLVYVITVVRWHDKPWFVFRRWLRTIAWDLRFADAFLARYEDRENPGSPPPIALDESIEWVLRETPWIIRLLYWREIRDSIRVLRQVIIALTA